MNTQTQSPVAANSQYQFVTVPQDNVKYRFDNISPFTIYVCDRSASSLAEAISISLAIVRAGERHTITGRFVAPLYFYTAANIDFGFSNQIDQAVTLATTLQSETSEVETLPVVYRSDDGGLDNLFKAYTSFSSGLTTLPIVDMQGFFGLVLSWNFLDSWYLYMEVETSDDQSSWQFVTSLCGQSIYQVLPKVAKYFRVRVSSGNIDGGASVSSVSILGARIKTPQAPIARPVDNDSFFKVVSSSQTPTITLPAIMGEQSFMLNMTGGNVRTLILVNTDVPKYFWLVPSVPTIITFNAVNAGPVSVNILTPEATPRGLNIKRINTPTTPIESEDLFPSAFSALSTGTTLDVIPMQGYEGLEIAWANSDNWPLIQVYGGDTSASVTQLIGQYTCQHSSVYIPATHAYIKLVVTGYSVTGATTTDIRLNVARTRTAQAPRNVRLSQDSYSAITVASGTTPSYSLSAKAGQNTLRLNLTGTTKTLVRVNAAIPKYLWLMPAITERLNIFSVDDTVFTIDILTSQAANRSLSIRIHDPMPDEQDASDVRYSLVNGWVLSNANPTQNFSTSSIGWDWMILELATSGMTQSRELQVRDDTTLNSYRLFVSQNQNANVRRKFLINNRAGNAAFTFTAVGLAAGESIVVYAHLAKGLPNCPVED